MSVTREGGSIDCDGYLKLGIAFRGSCWTCIGIVLIDTLMRKGEKRACFSCDLFIGSAFSLWRAAFLAGTGRHFHNITGLPQTGYSSVQISRTIL